LDRNLIRTRSKKVTVIQINNNNNGLFDLAATAGLVTKLYTYT